MFTRRKLILSLALALSTASASAGPILYVVTFNGQFGPSTRGQFGTIDPTTGAYRQIGPAMTDPLGGILPGPNGGYIGVSFSGNLVSVNPSTGTVTVIGATGLGNSALDTAELDGKVYETDLNNDLYSINPATGAASFIGPTGIDPSPTDPADLIDEAFFAVGGKLYATWDAFNATTMAIVDDPELYQINPTTGVATFIGDTAFQLDAVAEINGTTYGFTATNTVLTLDLATGNTKFVSNYDPAAFFITGATAAPEPVSFVLAGAGLAAILVFRRRRRHSTLETRPQPGGPTTRKGWLRSAAGTGKGRTVWNRSFGTICRRALRRSRLQRFTSRSSPSPIAMCGASVDALRPGLT